MPTRGKLEHINGETFRQVLAPREFLSRPTAKKTVLDECEMCLSNCIIPGF